MTLIFPKACIHQIHRLLMSFWLWFNNVSPRTCLIVIHVSEELNKVDSMKSWTCSYFYCVDLRFLLYGLWKPVNTLEICNIWTAYTFAFGDWIDFISHLQGFVTKTFRSITAGFHNLVLLIFWAYKFFYVSNNFPLHVGNQQYLQTCPNVPPETKSSQAENHCCKEIKPVNPKWNQSQIYIGRTDAETPILWPRDAKSQLSEKDPDAGKIEDNRRRGWQRMRWLNSITDSMAMNLSEVQEIVEDIGAWGVAVHEVSKSQTWLSDWKTTATHCIIGCSWRVFWFVCFWLACKIWLSSSSGDTCNSSRQLLVSKVSIVKKQPSLVYCLRVEGKQSLWTT